MSGFEVAGLALAVFPVLVDGLDRVVSGIETIKRWRRYKLKLKEYANIMESAYVFFLDTLDELLGDIILSDEELTLMLKEPGGTLWKKPEYEQRLRARLDRSYSSYMKTVATLKDALEAMCERLGVDRSGSIKLDDASIVDRYMQRCKVTFSKHVYQELLDNIRRANRHLREITHQNIALEPLKRKRQSRKPIEDLKIIRKTAASLYQVIMNDKAWQCQCKNHHVASLRLEARPQTIEEIRNDGQTHAFRILLSVTDDLTSTITTTKWEDIEIIPSLASSERVEQPKSPQSSLRREPMTKSVSFAVEKRNCLTGLADAAKTAAIDRKYIQNICSALCAADHEHPEIGLVVDNDNDKQQHRLYRANTAVGTQTSSRSLEDLLTSGGHSSDDGLSRRDRLRIAVVLASSVLQLDGTSWMKKGWSSDDIFFHYKDGRIPEQLYPYLAWQRCCKSHLTHSMESLRISNIMIRNETLLDLGLTLVELCFGRTLADMRRSEDGESGENATRLRTATRLHGRVYDEMGLPYGDVVRRCLFQLFDVRDLSLHLEEVQQKVLDDVVAPLVDDLNNFNGHLKIR